MYCSFTKAAVGYMVSKNYCAGTSCMSSRLNRFAKSDACCITCNQNPAWSLSDRMIHRD